MSGASKPAIRATLLGAVLVSAGALAGPPTGAEPLFEEITEATGLSFVYYNGMAGALYTPEVMGGGAAFLDYDGDGDLDLYLVQGAFLPLGERPEGAEPPGAALPLRDRLLRADHRLLPDGSLEIRLVDVTERAGIVAEGYGMGVAVGDFTNNGCPDLYVTNLGPNQLFRNECDGTFTDVTAESGTGDPSWSASATFFDATGDGWLDLFVTSYVDASLDDPPRCATPLGIPDWCGPADHDPVPDHLYLNRGDGTFVDATEVSGIAAAAAAHGLGVVAADFNGSGRLDLFVANDHVPNHLWINQGEGRFTEEALLAGVSVNREGLPEAGMGVDAGDLTGNGLPDLFLTHLNGETNTLYANLGGGLFRDQTARAGLAGPSLPYTGFGTVFFDLDNDGWLDIAAVNGQISLGVVQQELLEGDPFPLGQRNQIFRNLGEGRFVEVQDGLGAAFEASEVGRGLAAGDLDNDGAVDLLIANNSGPARLLRNLAAAGGAWVGFLLDPGPGQAAHAPGSQVEVLTADGRRLHRIARTDGSYLSARDPRVVVGLGPEGEATSALVRWPDGGRQRFEAPATGYYLVVRRGAVERADP